MVVFHHSARRLLLLVWSTVSLAHHAQAQLLTTSGVDITVGTGVAVTVEGAVQLNAASTITNQGELRVQGDWTNNTGNTGLTASSNGTVHLFGSAPQGIAGSSITDFRHLRLTGGIKQLLQNAVVGLPGQPDGTLELGSGCALLLENQTFTVFDPLGTAVVDNGGWVASESLNSRFQWALGNDVTEHRVPFGAAAGPAFPFAFTPAAPFPANTLLSIATYATAPDNTVYPLTANQQVLHMAGTTNADNSANTVDRFWLVDLPDGTFNGTLLLSHSAADDPQFGPGAIRAQRWSESAGTWEGPLPGQVNTGIREVRVPAVLLSNAVVPSNEHIWALAYDNTPLPIQLISFDARAEENAWVRCSWITASEQDNDFFTVERSRDGIRFEEVGVVDGAGNSVSTLTYEFRDPGPYLGLSYYRLRQTDFDGSSSWSQAVAVTLTRDEGISVYPNPNNGRFTISRSEVGGPLDLELLDGAGRRIQAWRMTEGMVRLDVETDIASGIYTLRWLGGSAKVSVSR